MRALIRRTASGRVRVACTALAVLGLALASTAPDARAQNEPPAAVDTSQSAAMARATAVRALEAFERRRRRQLPRLHGPVRSCDVTVGRLCYWYDESAPTPPPEPAGIALERRGLLATLDAAGRAAPGDDLIAGQRVRYRLEAGQADSALLAARDCAATPWWCAALRGWALHAAADAAGAGAAFDSALAGMAAAERCRWRDMTLLLRGPTRARYAALSCEQRGELEARLWWLATPFLSRGGNDRRNEHFARLAFARLASESPTPYRLRWDDDLHELLIRYGWADRWTRREAPSSSAAIDESIVGHEPVPAYAWLPEGRLLDDPYTARPDDWKPADPDAHERYAPVAPRRLTALDASATVLRRGDSLLVVATYRKRDGAAPADTAGWLVLAREGHGALVQPLPADGVPGVVTAMAPSAPYLLSVELFGDSATAARGRFAIRPPEAGPAMLHLSELLPFEPVADADTTLDAAIRLAVRGSEHAVPSRLAIYWELYDLPPGRHQLDMALQVVGERPGWLGRTWNRLRGAAPAAAPNLRWTDVVQDDGARGQVSRVIAMQLPSLPPGRYEVRLRVSDRRTGEVVERVRELRLRH